MGQGIMGANILAQTSGAEIRFAHWTIQCPVVTTWESLEPNEAAIEKCNTGN